MTIIWNSIDGTHDIKPKGILRKKFDKYVNDGKLPNKNVTAAQAETVIKLQLDPLLLVDGVHLYIHIFSFPKRTQEHILFKYVLWIGHIGTEPGADWWEN
jgi:hypothetical protein